MGHTYINRSINQSTDIGHTYINRSINQSTDMGHTYINQSINQSTDIGHTYINRSINQSTDMGQTNLPKNSPLNTPHFPAGNFHLQEAVVVEADNMPARVLHNVRARLRIGHLDFHSLIPERKRKNSWKSFFSHGKLWRILPTCAASVWDTQEEKTPRPGKRRRLVIVPIRSRFWRWTAPRWRVAALSPLRVAESNHSGTLSEQNSSH